MKSTLAQMEFDQRGQPTHKSMGNQAREASPRVKKYYFDKKIKYYMKKHYFVKTQTIKGGWSIGQNGMVDKDKMIILIRKILFDNFQRINIYF